jgi:hypothetical protein
MRGVVHSLLARSQCAIVRGSMASKDWLTTQRRDVGCHIPVWQYTLKQDFRARLSDVIVVR